MKKIIIIIGIILGLVLINIFSINSYYNNFEGNKLYENKDFSGALEFFEKEKNSIGLYNLGNTNYRLGEQEKKDNKKIEYWEKSVDFYKNSLKLKYDPRTEYNYNFVLDKFKKLKKKQEEEKQKQEEKNQDNKQNGDNKKDGKQSEKNGEKDDSKQGNSQEGNSQNSGDNKGKSEPQLSKEAKDQIKAYEEKLKQDQKKNAGNFGKVYQENNRNDIFNNFNSFFEDDPFFNNSLLDNDEKKDW